MSQNVLERLVAGKKLPILFIGSGISKRYLYKYPNWDQLLEMSLKSTIPIYFSWKNTESS